jgi:hypothetical protein
MFGRHSGIQRKEQKLTDTPKYTERLDAWVDGSAICVVAVSSHGDPLDLNEHEVEAFIEKLRQWLAKTRGM